MTDDMKQEWIEDMKQEAKEEEWLEHHLRSDFDNFCDHNIEAIEQLNEAIKELKQQCELYDYDFDIDEYIY